MTTNLTKEDIDEKFQDKVYVQDYKDSSTIQGVTTISLTQNNGEDGDFCELLHLDESAEIKEVPGFHIVQINRSVLFGNMIKAWHLHFKQNELWYINPEGRMLAGLLDVRKKSPTRGNIMRIILGGGNQKLLFIPNGVAHGSINLISEQAIIWYFVDQTFDKDHPDEYRLHWDILGKDFWLPQRD